MSENSYNQSIGKNKEIKLEILLKLKQLERDRDNTKAILELKENAELRTKSGNGKGNGKYRNRDSDKSTPKANGPKDRNGYYLCGNCGKTHKGICRKPVKRTMSDKNTTRLMRTGCPQDVQSVTSSADVFIPTHSFTLACINILIYIVIYVRVIQYYTCLYKYIDIYSYLCQGYSILTISPALIQYF